MNYGFIEPEIKKEDYKQYGPVKLGGAVLRPSGQWDEFLPVKELQDRGIGTMSCTSYGTLNAVETLAKLVFGDTTNWSDRFLAERSGTTQEGNDPHTVAETLRKKGTVYESDWPYPETKTWGAFYQTPPFELEVDAQVKFRGKYNFGHSYVGVDPQSMKTALQYSPLGVDVYAWGMPDGDEIYHREGRSNHWTIIYGYNLTGTPYWKCFDSYDNSRKKLAWDFGFGTVKQYTLQKQVLNESLWDKAIKWFLNLHPSWGW